MLKLSALKREEVAGRGDNGVIRKTGSLVCLRAKSWQIALCGLILAVFLPGMQVRAEDWSRYSNDAIVKAIWHSEGGEKTKFPYGVKSIDTKGDIKYARRICYNSVCNGRARWKKAGKPDDLIVFIGKRYCPPSAHSLNRNWVRNVKYFLEKIR